MKIQFCDFYADDFFWVGIEWSEDDKNFNKVCFQNQIMTIFCLFQFNENLEFKNQSFFKHFDKEKKSKKQKQKKTTQKENVRNVETPMSGVSSSTNVSQNGGQAVPSKKPLVSNCMLHFEPFDVINMKSKVFTGKDQSNPNYVCF